MEKRKQAKKGDTKLRTIFVISGVVILAIVCLVIWNGQKSYVKIENGTAPKSSSQSKGTASENQSDETSESEATSETSSAEKEEDEDYYIQEGAWQGKHYPEETKAKGEYAYNYAAYHKTVAYMAEFGADLLAENSLYLPTASNTDNRGVLFLTPDYRVIVLTTHVTADGAFELAMETHSLENNQLLTQYSVGYESGQDNEFSQLSDTERWQYIYDHYPDFQAVERVPDTINIGSDTAFMVGQQGMVSIEGHEEFMLALYGSFGAPRE
ncbi:hypothetical protein Hs30E_00340 [Lactococcus hodotermopsidis]|uniref:Uncharacterized protein n=1 Tax=Pseudolactococcus hodotermopsidis TaxID=2709157 RepID=A0A6A0BA25_9LACT|nr:hypothetical protein [Lactococcus hodotermopsidis]GFH41483.1 hypothetical protein Hs30E_00340 [Lactococcus hodotermopsidis]